MGGAGLEHGNICTLWNLNDQGVARAFACVILAKFRAEAACLNAHDRVGFGVVVRRPVKGFQSEVVLLQQVRLPVQGPFHDQPKKPFELVGSGECLARQDAFELRANLGRGRGHSFSLRRFAGRARPIIGNGSVFYPRFTPSNRLKARKLQLCRAGT
jgi:hypothetical protein